MRTANPGIVIEVLVPDFNDKDWALQMVMEARPHIFNHNLETVERLTPLVRSRAQIPALAAGAPEGEGDGRGEGGDQERTHARVSGERTEEVLQAMDDLREHGVTVLTMGQYLRPTPRHLPVVEYIRPEEFEDLKADRPREGLPPRGERAAGAQFLPRRGFPAGTRSGKAGEAEALAGKS